MFSERLQILVSPQQRKLLEAEAKRAGRSVAALIREAVDQHLGIVDTGTRVQAVAGIRSMRGRYLSPDELNRLVDEERSKDTSR